MAIYSGFTHEKNSHVSLPKVDMGVDIDLFFGWYNG